MKRINNAVCQWFNNAQEFCKFYKEEWSKKEQLFASTRDFCEIYVLPN